MPFVPAPSAQDLHAGHFGEAEIEHRRVVGFRFPQMLPVFPVRRDVDREVLLAQRARDLLSQEAIVFDQEYFHAALTSGGTSPASLTQSERNGSGWIGTGFLSSGQCNR